MSVGFGFSAGDFIAAIELVRTVVDALRSSGNAGAEYRELVSQLLILESALIQVKRLEFEESQYSEVIALRQAAARCRRAIDAFWEKTRKYQPALGGTGSSSRLKDGWMKVKWAVCKKDDVAKFKADLVGHTESIQLLLATVQMSKTKINDDKQNERQKSLAGRVQEGYFSCMQRLIMVVGQGKQLLDMTSSILRTNVKVFQIVLQIQQMITNIPGRVERQQPVFMIDALGRASPFHLVFIRSAEALIAVLKVNFKKHGNGAEKIERGDFVIQDAVSKRDINLRNDWEICFTPGQRVVMSMIISRALVPGVTCPKCHTPNFGAASLQQDEDIDCSSCGLVYRRAIIQEVTDMGDIGEPITIEPDEHGSAVCNGKLDKIFGPPTIPSKRKFDGEDIADYRRVRIRDKPLELPDVSGSSLASSSPPWMGGEAVGGLPVMRERSLLITAKAQYGERFALSRGGALYGLPQGPSKQERRLTSFHTDHAKPFWFLCLRYSCGFRLRVADTTFEISAAERTMYNHFKEKHWWDSGKLGDGWQRKLKELVESRLRETCEGSRAITKIKNEGE